MTRSLSFRFIRARRVRRHLAVPLLVAFGLVLQAASCGPLRPEAGLPEYRLLAVVDTPGGRVDTAGGNLVLARSDLDIDTRVGNLAAAATWNSATAQWLWNFDLSYDGAVFVDATGAVHSLAGIANGAAIPGTMWVKVNDSALKTKGGLLYAFGAAGKLSVTRWSSDPLVALEYTSELILGEPRITAIESCRLSVCVAVYSIRYDEGGRVAEIVDRTGRQALYSYDDDGHLIAARDALDLASGWPGWRYEYEGDQISARTSSEGERVEYSYYGGYSGSPWGSRVREIKQIGSGYPAWTFSYFAKSAGSYTTRITSPGGGTAIVRYDGDRRVRSKRSEEGDLTSWTWQGSRPASRTDAWGATTSWEYANDDVATLTLPSGRVVTFAYEPSGIDPGHANRRAIASVADDLGVVVAKSYLAGRPVAVTNGAGETTEYTYNGVGELSSTTFPNGVTASFSAYGEHGHAAAISGAGGFESRVYNGVGDLLEGSDFSMLDGAGLGGVVSRSFDADRNVKQLVVSNLDSTTSTSALAVTETGSIDIAWRSDHRRLGVERPYGGDTSFSYDELGRLVRRSDRADGLWRDTLFAYGPAGSLTAVERPNGMRTEWAYDLAGRRNRISHLRGGVLESSATLHWGDGLIRSLFDTAHGASESYTYDPAGRRVAIHFPLGEELVRGFDLRSRVVREDFLMPDNSVLRTLAYDYDGADRLVATRDDGTEVVVDSYVAGRVSQRATGNGLLRAFAYDSQTGQLTGTTTANDLGEPVENTTVVFASCLYAGVSASCLNAETTTAGGVPATTHELYQMSKDSLIQGLGGLRVARWADAIDAPSAGDFYSYDALSNLTSIGDLSGVETLVYNAEHNRLLAVTRDSATVSAYSYDQAGFMTARDGLALTWTAAGRVETIGGVQSFLWDSFGSPIERVTPAASVGFRFGGAVETDLAGTPTVLDLGLVAISLGSGDRIYRHHDFRQNVKFVTDDSGSVIAHYEYSSFGLEAVTGSGADAQRFAQGHDLGELVVLGARVYDPYVGRFVSPDPVYQLFDQHTYTIGNPVFFWDPGGLYPDPVPGTTTVMPANQRSGRASVEVPLDGYPNNALDADLRMETHVPVLAEPFRRIYLIALGGASAGGGSGSAGGGGGGEGGSDPGCAATPVGVPHASTLLAILLPMQIVAGWAVLRKKATARDSSRDRRAGIST